MNHALRWTHDQVPLEARGIAREAARLEGKTLSHWLRNVVEVYATAIGQPEHELTDEDRAVAIALRLKQLRRSQDGIPENRRPFSDEGGPAARHGRRVPDVPSHHRLLDQAIDMLELRPRHAPLDDDLGASFRADPVERHAATRHPHESHEPRQTAPKIQASRSLDEKLDSILHAVQTRPAGWLDPDNLMANRRFDQTYANERAHRDVPPKGAPRSMPRHDDPAPTAPPGRIRREVEVELISLCSEISESLREHRERRDRHAPSPRSAPAAPADVTRERPTAEIAARAMPTPTASRLSQSAASRPYLGASAATIVLPSPQSLSAAESVALTAIGSLQQQVADLSSRVPPGDTHREKFDAIDQKLHQLAAAQALTAGRLEASAAAAARKAADGVVKDDRSAALDAAARDVAASQPKTADDRIDAYRVKLEAIDQQLHQLAEDQAKAAGRFEAGAELAARKAVDAMIGDERFAALDTAARDVAASRNRQDIADTRTRATLEAVCTTLEKVAERLASVENGMVSARLDRSSVDVPPAPVPLTSSIAAPVRPVATAPAAVDRSSASTMRQAQGAKTIESSAIEKDFIAQARRAATAGRKPAVDVRRPLVQPSPAPAPPGFAQQAHDYLTRNRRPIGIGLAATCVLAGLTEIVQLSGVGPSDNVAIAAARPIASPLSPAKDHGSRDTFGAASKDVAGLHSMAFDRDSLQTASFTKGMPRAPETLATPMPPLPDNGPAAYAQGDSFAEGRGVARDFARAALAFERAAVLGIVPAEVRLAALYEKGLGVGRDREKAKTLYTKAANAGNPLAMHNLAVLLTDGAGHPDYETATAWFRKAAQFGVRDSQFNLGVFYAEGIGVTRSYMDSYQWFAIAAAKGDEAAARKRDVVATKLSANDLLVAKALADSFHPRRPDPAAVTIPSANPDSLTATGFSRV